MSDNIVNRIGEKVKEKVRKLSVYVLLVLVLLLITSTLRNISRVRRANLRINETQVKVDKLKKENKDLEDKLNEVKSGEYIEKQLRDKLGYAKEGEIVLIMPDEETLRKLAPVQEDEETTLPDPNWKKWLHLFDL